MVKILYILNIIRGFFHRNTFEPLSHDFVTVATEFICVYRLFEYLSKILAACFCLSIVTDDGKSVQRQSAWCGSVFGQLIEIYTRIKTV